MSRGLRLYEGQRRAHGVYVASGVLRWIGENGGRSGLRPSPFSNEGVTAPGTTFGWSGLAPPGKRLLFRTDAARSDPCIGERPKNDPR